MWKKIQAGVLKRKNNVGVILFRRACTAEQYHSEEIAILWKCNCPPEAYVPAGGMCVRRRHMCAPNANAGGMCSRYFG